MKKLAAILCLSALATGAFAQGTVNFFNNSGTLISTGVDQASATAIPATAGLYYFGLLTAPVGSTQLSQFSFANVYGTNQAVAGRFTGGVGSVAGWSAGTQRAFRVMGWSLSMGHDFQNSWLSLTQPVPGVGWSSIATGSPGGFNAGTGGTDPNLPIFNATTIATGFLIPVPEPTTMALAGLGAAALLIFRRRK